MVRSAANAAEVDTPRAMTAAEANFFTIDPRSLAR